MSLTRRATYVAVTLGLVLTASVVVLPLRAAIAAPLAPVEVSPAKLTFGSQEVGTTSSERTVVVTNDQATDLIFSGIFINQGDAADFSIRHTDCPHTLIAGGHCSIDVVFRPTSGAFGPRSTTLEVNDDGPNSPQSVTIVGDVSSPSVEVSPSDLSFGAWLPGQISPAQRVTLKNKGGGDLTITDLKLDPTDDFNILAGDCLRTIHGGGSCSVDVVYSPKTSQGDVKAIRTAVLTFTDNDPETPSQVVSLDGRVPTPFVQLSPTSIDFGSQASGTASASRTVTLRNVGTGTMTIQALEMKGLDPDDFKVTANSCAGTLGAGQECTFGIAFTPEKLDVLLSALLTITDDAPSVTQTVALVGKPLPAGSAPHSAPPPAGTSSGGGAAAPARVDVPATSQAPAQSMSVTPGGSIAVQGDAATPQSLVDGPARAQHGTAPGVARSDSGNALTRALSDEGVALRVLLDIVLMVLPVAAVGSVVWWGRRRWIVRRK